MRELIIRILLLGIENHLSLFFIDLISTKDQTPFNYKYILKDFKKEKLSVEDRNGDIFESVPKNLIYISRSFSL